MKTRRLVSKVRKSFRYGEKGFTLIELLIVVAILAILAAVVLPNVGGFLRTGNLAAANTEAAEVRTACAADYAENQAWPANSLLFYARGYLDREPEEQYNFANNNTIITSVTAVSGKWTDQFNWNDTDQQWELP